MSARIARRVVVTGRVQGVGFRHWTAETARDLGLAGWVRNRRDGTVEAVFEGPAEAVGRMIEVCARGPRAARVESVKAEDVPRGNCDSFKQRATA